MGDQFGSTEETLSFIQQLGNLTGQWLALTFPSVSPGVLSTPFPSIFPSLSFLKILYFPVFKVHLKQSCSSKIWARRSWSKTLLWGSSQASSSDNEGRFNILFWSLSRVLQSTSPRVASSSDWAVPLGSPEHGIYQCLPCVQAPAPILLVTDFGLLELGNEQQSLSQAPFSCSKWQGSKME